MSFEIEVPAALITSVVESSAFADSLTPVLINCNPASGEVAVPGAVDIQLDLAIVGSTPGTVSVAATSVYVAGMLAFAAGVFQTGFTGSYWNPQVDVLTVSIHRNAIFASEQVVTVRAVSSATGDAGVLDQTYSFTIADTTPPQIASATATDLTHVLVTFNEAIAQSGDGTALDVGDWQLDRLGDYVTPLVSAAVIAVDPGTTAETVVVTTDTELTPGGNYRLTATTLEDISGNAIVAPFNTVDFVGWLPPSPAGRTFDLFTKLPSLNQSEDGSQDLYRFVACLQEVAGLLLYDVDRFVDILDPDTAPEDFVDAMLADLGNPFAFELTLIDKRRLAQVLVDMYQLKGTGIGIVNVIRFFVGLEAIITIFNSPLSTWVLGESTLGDDTDLGTLDSRLLYSFSIFIPAILTDDENLRIRAIVDFMKPAHTHLLDLIDLQPGHGVMKGLAADGVLVLSYFGSGTAAQHALAASGAVSQSYLATGSTALSSLAATGGGFRDNFPYTFIEDITFFDNAQQGLGGISSDT